jgi:NAD(P)-dependent dehydrogenase (short-subunit alcohol dehydrogenase family)
MLGHRAAIAQKFAQDGFFVVLTTRNKANASALARAIQEQGGECMFVELNLVSQASITTAFATIRDEVGDADVLIYNAGYTWKALSFLLRKNCSNRPAAGNMLGRIKHLHRDVSTHPRPVVLDA